MKASITCLLSEGDNLSRCVALARLLVLLPPGSMKNILIKLIELFSFCQLKTILLLCESWVNQNAFHCQWQQRCSWSEMKTFNNELQLNVQFAIIKQAQTNASSNQLVPTLITFRAVVYTKFKSAKTVWVSSRSKAEWHQFEIQQISEFGEKAALQVVGCATSIQNFPLPSVLEVSSQYRFFFAIRKGKTNKQPKIHFNLRTRDDNRSILDYLARAQKTETQTNIYEWKRWHEREFSLISQTQTKHPTVKTFPVAFAVFVFYFFMRCDSTHPSFAAPHQPECGQSQKLW